MSEKIARQKDKIFDTLEILKMWYRDLMIVKFSPEKIINQDLIKHIKDISDQMHMASILLKFEAIQSAQRYIEGNANPRLTLDVMMLKIMTP